MTVSCSITFSFPNQEKRHQEVALVERAANLAVEDIRSAGGFKLSGNIVDAGFARVVDADAWREQLRTT